MSLYRNDRCNADPKLVSNGVVPRRGGGVLIYVKQCWVPYISICVEGTIISGDIEILSLKLDKPRFRKLYISVVYKPPRGKIENCLNYFENLFLSRDIGNRERWILGDFNVNLEIRNSPDTIRVNRFLKDNSLKQLITSHTHLTHRGGSCIDWIITDCMYVKESGVLDELVSDHFSVFAIRKKNREVITKKWITFRTYKNFNKDVFSMLLLTNNWNPFFAARDVDVMWDMIHAKIIEILELMCPIKRACLRDPKTPWVNADIIKAVKERRQYLRIYKRTKNQFIWDICKYLRNRCNSMIQGAKATYIKNILLRTTNDPRKFWKSINNLLKGPKKEIIAHEFLDANTGEVINETDICDFLNNYYVNIGAANKVIEPPRPIWSQHDPGFVFEPITREEVKEVVKRIDEFKDSCIKGISTTVLKEVFNVLTDHLTYLFNVSFEESKFPRVWAKGFINILPKGGKLNDPSNWRPITQTLLPAKILEKLVQKRFYKILQDENFLDVSQYGFLPGKSTQLAIFDLLKDIYEAKILN